MIHGRTSVPLSNVIVKRSSHSSSSSEECADDFNEVPEPTTAQLDQQLDNKLTEEHLDRSALIVVDLEGANIDVNLISTLKLSPDLHTHACNVANKLAQKARTALVEVQVPVGGAVLPAVLPQCSPQFSPAQFPPGQCPPGVRSQGRPYYLP
jgi:hypothetical protein